MSGKRQHRPPKPTLNDVCRRTGLSTATVSRVLSRADNVRPATRQRVLQAVADLGYIPNHAAQTLAGKRNRLIGVVFPEISTGFWADMLKGIDAAADDRNFHILTAFSHGDRDERDLALRLIHEGRIDALIVMNLRLGSAFVTDARKANVPLVMIDRPVDAGETASVTIDNVGGARAAMTHLIEHGYDDILILAGDVKTYDARQRLEGCRLAVAAAGRAWDESRVVAGSFTEEGGRLAMKRALKGCSRPRAVFSFNDNVALGAMAYLREEVGLAVPGDVALVGFDDVDAARHVGLTTVRVPVAAMGAAAANVAIAAMLGEPFESRVVVGTELVVRRSCGCDAVGAARQRPGAEPVHA